MQITIRDLDEATFQELRRLATSQGRSLEEEAKEMLRWAVWRMASLNREELFQEISAFHMELGIRPFSPSADLIREDRDAR